MLTKGQLDMKIGSSERVDRIFQMGAAGLKFAHTPTPPRLAYDSRHELFPGKPRLGRMAKRPSLTLAIRLNELKIAGNIQGQRTLTIPKSDGQSTTMEFTLFVVK